MKFSNFYEMILIKNEPVNLITVGLLRKWLSCHIMVLWEEYFIFLCAAESRTLRRAQRRERRWTRRWSRCWTWSWSGWSSASTNRPPSRLMATGPPSWTTRCPVRRSVHARPGNDQSELLRRPSLPPATLPLFFYLLCHLWLHVCSSPPAHSLSL